MSYVDAPLVKILTGVRRCGKSTILKMVMEELKQRGIAENRILHYNFDSLEYDELKTSMELFIEIKQHLSDEEKVYVDIYVTGSNSRMMSSEIST